MFIELVDVLRCTRPHEDSWLVLRADLMAGRHVVTGVLGCPVCGAGYPVENGEASFLAPGGDLVAPAPAPAPAADAAAPSPPWLDDDEAPLRLAALLALSDVRHPVLLAGRWGGLAVPLAGLAPALYLVANPPHAIAPRRDELSVIRATDRLPVAEGRFHGAALDAGALRAGLLEGAARAVRAGGRLVAPVSAPLPADFTELGRDDFLWVAERRPTPVGAPVPLARAPRAG